MGQLTNIDRWAFLLVPGTPDAYKRIGKGVTGITPSNNPQTDSKHYVDAKNPTTTVHGISKQWTLTMERYKGDPANDYIASLSEKLDTSSYLVIAEAHLVPDSPATGEEWYRPATRYPVDIVVNSEGSIVGGGAMDMDVVIHASGPGVAIEFDIEEGEIV